MRKLIVAALGALTVCTASAAGWTYSTDVAELDGVVFKLAALQSVDQLALRFPYEGENFGRLTVRRSSRTGLDAYFEIERGQLVCGYPCRIQVSFDGKPAQTFDMLKSADGNPRLLFFANGARFVKAASGARLVKIAATVYQAGQPVLTFRSEAPLTGL